MIRLMEDGEETAYEVPLLEVGDARVNSGGVDRLVMSSGKIDTRQARCFNSFLRLRRRSYS